MKILMAGRRWSFSLKKKVPGGHPFKINVGSLINDGIRN